MKGRVAQNSSPSFVCKTFAVNGWRCSCDPCPGTCPCNDLLQQIYQSVLQLRVASLFTKHYTLLGTWAQCSQSSTSHWLVSKWSFKAWFWPVCMRICVPTCATCPHLKPAVAAYKLKQTQYENSKEMPASKFFPSLCFWVLWYPLVLPGVVNVARIHWPAVHDQVILGSEEEEIVEEELINYLRDISKVLWSSLQSYCLHRG